MQDDEDYWHWRVQSTARREVLRLAQILCHSAALATPATMQIESFLQVVGSFFARAGNDSLVNSLLKLRALEPPAVPTDLERWIDEHQLTELAQAACDIFSLTVAALERRERLLDDLRRELDKNTRQLSQMREQETQEFLKSEELREQLQELRGRLSASEYERGRNLPALQNMVTDFWRDAQTQLQAKESLLQQLQAEIKDLSVALRGQEIENRQHEHRQQELTGLLRRSQQTVTQLREQRTHVQQERDELRQLLLQAEGERDRAQAAETRFQAEASELRGHNGRLQTSLAEMQQSMRALEQVERAAQRQVEQLNHQLQRQAEELATLSTLGEHCCNLELLLAQKSEENEQLAAAQNEAQHRMARLDEALRLLRERAGQLNVQLREAKRRLTHYEGGGRSERDQLLNWGSQLENELKQARQNLADQRQWALAAEERDRASQAELAAVKAELLGLLAQRELNQARDLADQREECDRVSQAELSSLKAELAGLLAAKDSQLDELRRELSEWQQRCQQLTALEGLPTELADTNHRLARAQETCLKLRDLLLSARTEQTRLQHELARTREELAEERQQLQEAAYQHVSQQEAHIYRSHESELELQRLRKELAQSLWQQQALGEELEALRERENEKPILEQLLAAERLRTQELLDGQGQLKTRLEHLESLYDEAKRPATSAAPVSMPSEGLPVELPGSSSFQGFAEDDEVPLWLPDLRPQNSSLEDPLLLPHFRY